MPFAGMARGPAGYVLIEHELVFVDEQTVEIRNLRIGNPGMRWLVQGQLERAHEKIHHWLGNQTKRKTA